MPVYSEQKRKNKRQTITRNLISILSIVAFVLVGFLAFVYWTLPDKDFYLPTPEPIAEASTVCDIRNGYSRDVQHEQEMQHYLIEQGYLALVELWWHPTIGQRIACTTDDMLIHTTAGGSGLFPYFTFYISSNTIQSPQIMGQYVREMITLLESNENDLLSLFTVSIQFVNSGQSILWQADYHDARWEINHGMDNEALFGFGMD